MEIRVNREDGLLLGERVHRFGERVEVADAVGRRHLKAGSAVLPVDDDETADGPAAPESADGSSPAKRRKG